MRVLPPLARRADVGLVKKIKCDKTVRCGPCRMRSIDCEWIRARPSQVSDESGELQLAHAEIKRLQTLVLELSQKLETTALSNAVSASHSSSVDSGSPSVSRSRCASGSEGPLVGRLSGSSFDGDVAGGGTTPGKDSHRQNSPTPMQPPLTPAFVPTTHPRFPPFPLGPFGQPFAFEPVERPIIPPRGNGPLLAQHFDLRAVDPNLARRGSTPFNFPQRHPTYPKIEPEPYEQSPPTTSFAAAYTIRSLHSAPLPTLENLIAGADLVESGPILSITSPTLDGALVGEGIALAMPRPIRPSLSLSSFAGVHQRAKSDSFLISPTNFDGSSAEHVRNWFALA